jgi:Tol biopolymer transport system component
MGEVYCARDPRLGRQVAIKVVAADGEPDRDRFRRFEDEARAVAALSHPNVLTLHDIGSHEGRPYLVLELLEGETLQQRLERGPLPLRQAVEVAVDICRGLDAAHARGLVHRDLKPGNVFLTSHGGVKILDFGLAKLTRGDVESGLSGAVAQGGNDTVTAAGIVVGTLGYLSPEQARGLGADGRSDLFALGAVLYEMVSGRRAFSGQTPADTLSAVLNAEPPPLTSPSGPVPPALERVVRECLAKDPEQRFHSAHDLALALETVLDQATSGRAETDPGDDAHPSGAAPVATPPPGPRAGRRLNPRLLVAGLVLAGVVAVLATRVSQDSAETPALHAVPLTTHADMENWPTFSPDGSHVAYQGAAADDDGAAVLVKQVGGAEALRRTFGPGLDHALSWSPDGRWIAFLRGDFPARMDPLRLLVIPPVAGAEREIARINYGVGWGARPAWTPDSQAVIVPDREGPTGPFSLYRISIDDGRRTRWTFPDAASPGEGDLDPAVSPDGTRLAFNRNGVLHLVELDDGLQPRGPPRELADLSRIADGELSGPFGLAWTANSRELVFPWGTWPDPRLYRISAEGGPIRPLGGLASGTFAPAISLVGDRLAYMEWIVRYDLWQIEVDEAKSAISEPSRLTASSRLDSNPVVSPGGERIAFHSNRAGRYGIWIASSSGEGARPLTPRCGEGDPPVPGRHFGWSPDETSIVFSARGDLFVADVASGACRSLTTGPSVDSSPAWSSDGWVYFSSSSDGVRNVRRLPAGGGPEEPVTADGGSLLAVSPDGSRVYYARDRTLWAIPAAGGEAREVVDPSVTDVEDFRGAPDYVVATKAGLFLARNRLPNRLEYLDLASGTSTLIHEHEDWILGLSASADGRRLVYSLAATGRSDLMLVESFR